MSTAEQHYENLLAPVYTWMVGGAAAAFETGAADLAEFLPLPGVALDLGCGFGMHAIPLARAGWAVTAMDSSPLLIEELRQHARGLPIRAVVGDLLGFAAQMKSGPQPQLIVCMGDTLTHLPDRHALDALARSVSAALAPGGRFVATFRDYTRLPEGTQRFIPVRADATRILTCFLEARQDQVEVTDLLYTLVDDHWKFSASAYRKLRLEPTALRQVFRDAGLEADLGPGPRGMVRLVAVRPDHPSD